MSQLLHTGTIAATFTATLATAVHTLDMSGVQHSMLANLSFTGKAGFQYTDNYNDPSGSTSVNPYADISLIYTYLPGSYAQVGFTETRECHRSSRFDTGNNGNIAVYTESSTLYASINHKLTPKLMGTVIGRWQHSIYNGGAYNNQADDYYNLGVNLSYNFNPHFSAEAGYNFDYLTLRFQATITRATGFIWGFQPPISQPC